MKYLFSFLTAILLSTTLFAQSPEKMSYQAVIRDNNDQLILNQSIGMQISILQGSATGTPVYVETQVQSTNANGLLTLEIGTGSTTNDFSQIDWANGPFYIKTETDPTGGTNYTITGTSQLLSVPYALHAKTADSVLNGGSGGFSHYIGEEFGGGVIFHLWKDKFGVEHGLIVALTDQSSGVAWSNIDTIDIGASAQSGFDGMSNSIAIVGQTGHTSSAASLAMAHMGGGFNDWYLPAFQELNTLFSNIFTVNSTLNTISGASIIVATRYWSSTEDDTNYWLYNYAIYHGYSLSQINKDVPQPVRAIRAF